MILLKNLSARPWRIVVIATLLALIPHIAFRSFHWRYEWALTFSVYSFSTVMLGPILAGLACGWASEFHRKASPLVVGGLRRTSFVLSESLTLIAPSIAVWLLGLLGVSLTTLIASSPGLPRPADILPVISALFFLLACSVVGFAIGWRAHRIWLPPVVALGLFGVVIWLYGTSFSPLVEVGGASGILVGKSPNIAYHGPQIAIFILLILALSSCALSSRRAIEIPAIVVTVVTVLGASFLTTNRFTEVNASLVCHTASSGREYCVARGYRGFLNALVTHYENTIARFEGLDVPIPRRLTQVYEEGKPHIDYFSDLRDPGYINQSFIWIMVPSSCDRDSILREIDVLIYSTGPSDTYREWLRDMPEEFKNASESERHTLAKKAVEGIRSCTPVFSR